MVWINRWHEGEWLEWRTFCAKKLFCGDIVKHGTNAWLKKKKKKLKCFQAKDLVCADLALNFWRNEWILMSQSSFILHPWKLSGINNCTDSSATISLLPEHEKWSRISRGGWRAALPWLNLQFLQNLEDHLPLTLNGAFTFFNALPPNSSSPEREGDTERLKTIEMNEAGERLWEAALAVVSSLCSFLLMGLLQPVSGHWVSGDLILL